MMKLIATAAAAFMSGANAAKSGNMNGEYWVASNGDLNTGFNTGTARPLMLP
jgi:hypothetical protein